MGTIGRVAVLAVATVAGMAACTSTGDDPGALPSTSAASEPETAPETTPESAPETTPETEAASPPSAPEPPDVRILTSPDLDQVTEAVIESLDPGAGARIAVSGSTPIDEPEHLWAALCSGEADAIVLLVPAVGDPTEPCPGRSVTPTRIDLGLNILVVVTSTANGDLDCITPGDLYALTGPEAAGRYTWAEANAEAREVGGFGRWPDDDLVLVVGASSEPAYDTAVRLVFEPIGSARGQAPTARPDYSTAGIELLETVAANRSSLGWFSYPTGVDHPGVAVVPVAADASGRCVEPGPATADAGAYPLAERLALFVDPDRHGPDVGRDAALDRLVEAYLGPAADDAVSAAGYLPTTEAARARARDRWDESRS